MCVPLIRAAGLLCLCCLAGCVSRPSPEFKAVDARPSPSLVQVTPVAVGDSVHVVVFVEDAVTGTYDVNPSGTIQLPLVGAIPATGQAPDALGRAIADRLRTQYLRDPKVTVDVVSVRPFYILGEVEKPGAYPYRSGLDIWRAMALAGGQTYRASSSTVTIQRAGETQWHDYDLVAAPAVEPGDVIRVPQRWF